MTIELSEETLRLSARTFETLALKSLVQAPTYPSKRLPVVHSGEGANRPVERAGYPTSVKIHEELL
jgi:hypothetical protein